MQLIGAQCPTIQSDEASPAVSKSVGPEDQTFGAAALNATDESYGAAQSLRGVRRRPTSLRGVIGFYAVYGLVHFAISKLYGDALALDDAKLNVVAQSLRGGYLPANPPLYEWLLWSVQQLTGPTLESFLVVKYGLMTVSGAFAYLTMDELMRGRTQGQDRRGRAEWAALAALSLLGLYQIGWNYHQAFTHTIVLITASLLFLWSVLRLIRRRRFGDYVLFGGALALGVLSKYAFVGLAAAVVCAMALRAPTRRVLLAPPTLGAIAAALFVLAPHALWVLSENSALAAQAGAKLQSDGAAQSGYLVRVFSGFAAALWAIASFFLPIFLIAAVVFRPSIRAALRNLMAPGDGSPALLVRDASLISIAGLTAAVALSGIGGFQERYAIAFLTPAFFWLFAFIALTSPSMPSRRLFGRLLAGLIVLFAVLRIVQAATPGAPFCSSCRQWIPHDGAKAVVQKIDNVPYGTLVGANDIISGNLRRLFPAARIASLDMPYYTPPAFRDMGRDAGRDLGRSCILVWSDDLGPPLPSWVSDDLSAGAIQSHPAPWRHPFKPTGWRRTIWKSALISPQSGLAQRLCG